MLKIAKMYGESLESVCRRILWNINPAFEQENYYDSYEEYLTEVYGDKFKIGEGEVYIVV